MKNLRKNSVDRKYCDIRRERNRIIIKIGPNTTLTHLRNIIKESTRSIKKIQQKIREDLKIKETKRERKRHFVNQVLYEEIYQLNKLSKKELSNILQKYGVDLFSNQKDIIIADIINQRYNQPQIIFGDKIDSKQISCDNVRKIVSRQKRLMKDKKC
jgi:DNA mismatch repair ATPase MutS